MVKVTKSLVEEEIQIISEVHNLIIKHSGGEQGIRDKGGLYNSICKILSFQEKNSNKPFSVGAFVLKELARKHHFVDGNKRTAYVFAKMKLLELCYNLKVDYLKAVPFIMKIAEFQSQIYFKGICEWVKLNSIKIPEEEIEKYLKETLLSFKTDKNEK